MLGRGSHGTVYLARDPGPGHKVAIRVLRGVCDDPTGLSREAHSLGELQHPHIVPVLELGEHMGSPYIVYSYTPGQSLKTYLRDNGPLPARKAARWMIRILDAMAHAHDQSVVHRDLTPASIQIDEADTLRVMDFGVSSLAAQPAETGTPPPHANYLAPELLHGGAAEPVSDIFSLGLILHEMVTGTPAVSSNDPLGTMRWMAHNAIAPPSARRAELEGEFDDVVQRALEKDPKDRYSSALEMQKALQSFLAGTAETERNVDDASALGFLLRRMRRRADFPAVARNMSLIGQKTASNSKTRVGELANIILKDYALTTKLLRLVNSSYYGQYGGHISTVSRAVVVLGLTQVRNAALSLLLFEHLGDKPQAYELREVAGRAFFSGNVGRRLAAALRVTEPERAFICSMLHTLGRYLTIYYFPEEHEEIISAVRNKGMDEDSASRAILGLTSEEIAIGVARDWRLPDEIVASMRQLPEKTHGTPANDREALRYIASFANRLTDIVILPPRESSDEDFARLRQRFKAYITVRKRELSSIVKSALDDLSAHADLFNMNLGTSRLFRNANEWLKRDALPAETHAAASSGQTQSTPEVAEEPLCNPSGTEAIVLNGMQDITQALLGSYALNDILVMVLETLYRGLGFDRVLLCIRDIKRGKMAARFGLGKDLDTLVKRFHFSLSPGDDLFSRAIHEHEDLVCNNPGTSDAVPDWYRTLVTPGAFVLCPIVVNGVALGLIYADREETDKPIGQLDLNHLNALRNQATLAVKQHS